MNITLSNLMPVSVMVKAASLLFDFFLPVSSSICEYSVYCWQQTSHLWH